MLIWVPENSQNCFYSQNLFWNFFNFFPQLRHFSKLFLKFFQKNFFWAQEYCLNFFNTLSYYSSHWPLLDLFSVCHWCKWMPQSQNVHVSARKLGFKSRDFDILKIFIPGSSAQDFLIASNVFEIQNYRVSTNHGTKPNLSCWSY